MLVCDGIVEGNGIGTAQRRSSVCDIYLDNEQYSITVTEATQHIFIVRNKLTHQILLHTYYPYNTPVPIKP